MLAERCDKAFMNQELDKQIILAAIRRHLSTILISAAVGMLLAFAVSNFMLDKQYESRAQILVSNVDEATIQKVTVSDLTAAKSMANTYRVIMTSTRATQALRERLAADPEFDLQYLDTYKLSTSVTTDTEVVNITIRCGNPKMAALICNTMVEVAGELISEIFDGGRCNPLGDAKVNYAPCFPNVRNMMLIGALIGMALAAVAILIVYLVDNRVKDEADFAAKIGILVLGEVPSIHELDSGKDGYSYYVDYQKQNS